MDETPVFFDMVPEKSHAEMIKNSFLVCGITTLRTLIVGGGGVGGIIKEGVGDTTQLCSLGGHNKLKWGGEIHKVGGGGRSCNAIASESNISK